MKPTYNLQIGQNPLPRHKAVVFEGAGWSGAENNGVGNCRIRGVFTDRKGQHIYLEMGGLKRHPYLPAKKMQYDFPGRVDHCFYLKDVDSNRSSGIAHFEREWEGEYTKQNIVRLLNVLNVECTDIEVINDGSYHVFDDPRYVTAKTKKEA